MLSWLFIGDQKSASCKSNKFHEIEASKISDYESAQILNEALEHGHGSGRPGYGNPP